MTTQFSLPLDPTLVQTVAERTGLSVSTTGTFGPGGPVSDPAYITANAAFAKANAVSSYTTGVDNTQNTTIIAVNQYAASAYNFANALSGGTATDGVARQETASIRNVDLTQNSYISIIQGVNLTQNTQIAGIQGVDNTQNTRIQSIETINTNQNTSINIIQGVDTWQNTQITYVNQFAQNAYDKANTGSGTASYTNSNVASYLPIYTGNILCNAITTGNVKMSASNVFKVSMNNGTTLILTDVFGRVAIGGTPYGGFAYNLDVTGSNGGGIRWIDTSGVSSFMGSYNNGSENQAIYGSLSSHNVAFWTQSAQQMYLSSNGLYVNASLGVGTAASGTTGEIRATNEVTAYYSSDETLKENIVTIDNALGKLKQVRGVMYDWKDSVIQSRGGLDDYFVRKHDTGVIAQDVEKVLPEVVAERPDGTKAVRYEKLAGIIIQAINELSEQVEEIKKRLN